MKISTRSFVLGFAAATVLAVFIGLVARARPGGVVTRTGDPPERVFTPDELFIDGWLLAMRGGTTAEWVWKESVQGKQVKASVVVQRMEGEAFRHSVDAATPVRQTADDHEVQHDFTFPADVPGAQSLRTGDAIDLRGRIMYISLGCKPDDGPCGASIMLRDPQWEFR